MKAVRVVCFVLLAALVSAWTHGTGVVVPVGPTNDWRIPISSAYDSAGNATVIAALAGSSTAKSFPQVDVGSSTTRIIGWALGAISAPGGWLYYNTRGGNTWTLLWEESFDSTNFVDGSWATVPSTPFSPVNRPGTGQAIYNDAGQRTALAAGAARKLRVTIGGGNSVSIFTGAFQLQTNPVRNDIWVATGMSITFGEWNPVSVIPYIQSIIAGSDPIVLNVARGGANGHAIAIECTGPALAEFPEAKIYVLDIGPNDFVNSRPWSTSPSPHNVRDGFIENMDLLDAAGVITYALDLSYGNYTGAPTVNGFTNLSNGSGPYNSNEIFPSLKVRSPTSWSTAFDAPQWYQGQTFATYLSLLNAVDGFHGGPGVAGLNSMFTYRYTGAAGTIWLQDQTTQSEPRAPAARKQRLLDVYGIFASTSEPVALANRATLLARINVITTTYLEPTYTGGAIGPLSLGAAAAGEFWFDGADWGFFTADDFGMTSVWTDKWNTYTLNQATVSTPVVQPQWQEKFLSTGKGAMVFLPNTFGSMSSTDANLLAALNSAGQPFTLFVVETASILSGQRDPLGWGGAASTDGFYLLGGAANSKLQAKFSTTATGPADSGSNPAVNTVQIYTFRYDGTTMIMRRNGVQVGSGAFALGAFTATVFKIGNKGGAAGGSWNGGILELVLKKSALTIATDVANMELGFQQKWQP